MQLIIALALLAVYAVLWSFTYRMTWRTPEGGQDMFIFYPYEYFVLGRGILLGIGFMALAGLVVESPWILSATLCTGMVADFVFSDRRLKRQLKASS